MYCRTDNAVWNPSMTGSMDTYKIKSVVTYVMSGLCERLENSLLPKQGIEKSAVGYNSEKYNQLEKLYSMAYANINSLEKNYIEANHTLDEIAKLDNNWNKNGASPFSARLIEKCRGIVRQLAAEPFICPTACGSIQFEYEKENGEYLEFEIYEDRIEVFWDTAVDGEKEFYLQGISATDKMKQLVVDFYG